MAFSKKLAPPIVSAAIAMIVFTNVVTVMVVKRGETPNAPMFGAIWPMALTSTVAIILMMSLLYRALLELITEMEKREIEARHLAAHDQLTGLANRSLLQERLNQARKDFRRDGDKYALLVLDLDQFKHVNDTLGHLAGDQLIQEAAVRLKSLVREADLVVRLGGDEFAVVQSRPRNDDDVRRLCARIITAFQRPFTLGNRETRVGVSIGAITVSRIDSDPSELLRRADLTMYQSKASGKNCYRLYSDEMDKTLQRRDRLETRLRDALDDNTGLAMHYQPQLNIDGAVVAVEALLRWHDAELGDLSPSEIIPIAEGNGLIDDLGEFAFDAACKIAKRWPNIVIAVNFSPLQFRRKDLVARLCAITRRHGVQCSQIEIEITENLFIKYSDVCEAVMSSLRDRGFRIALDDFGTGYSSLSYLCRFKVDKIKLDRSFISSVDLDQSISVIRAAAMLGHAMGLTVVAEGIVSAEHEQAAFQAGCDFVQGYRYAPAMPAAELDQYFALNNTERFHAKAA